MTQSLDSARGPVLWALLALCGICAGLIVFRWSQGSPDPVVTGVLLSGVLWAGGVGLTRGRTAHFFLAASPYFVSILALGTLAILQLTGDPQDSRHTNALLGAYLTLPVAYLLFFLLRRPNEALAGAIITGAIAAALQTILPPSVAGRETTGGWVAMLTSSFHGALLLLLYAVVRLKSDRELLNAVLQGSRDAVVLLSLPSTNGRKRQTDDPALLVTLANQAAANMFGVRTGDLLRPGDVGAEIGELGVSLAEALRRGEAVSANISLPTQTGHGWFRVTGTPSPGLKRLL